jgi:cell division protein FtsW
VRRKRTSVPIFDKYFVFAVLALLALGLIMLTSASSQISQHHYGQPFHYLFRQLLYLALGLGLGFFIFRRPILFWESTGRIFLILSFAALLLVLIPGIGHRINGSSRWLGFGPLTFQVSEFIKFAAVIYFAGYLVRHHQEVQAELAGFLKPLLVLGVIAVLLLLEPDFGATVVVVFTVFSMMFLANTKALPFIILLVLVVIAFALLAVSSPYRMARLTTFMHPWEYQYHSGYQLVQALLAFGRGGVFGVGLGHSLQKLFYLPEADTDFLFAVIAEELGLIGIVVVISLYALLVWRAMLIGRRALAAGFPAAGYMAFGFAVWLGMQAAINMGVNSGLLPTKGLTLPLMSYGGSSMVVSCMVIAVLLRIDYEVRAQRAKWSHRS